jgi:hypothetical protein
LLQSSFAPASDQTFVWNSVGSDGSVLHQSFSGTNGVITMFGNLNANEVLISGANAGLGAPFNNSDLLASLSAGDPLTLMLGAPVTSLGGYVQPTGSGTMTVKALGQGGSVLGTYTYFFNGAVIPQFLGISDLTPGELYGIQYSIGNRNFYIDSILVNTSQGADPLAPTAEATPLVLVGSGLAFLSWLKRRRAFVDKGHTKPNLLGESEGTKGMSLIDFALFLGMIATATVASWPW